MGLGWVGLVGVEVGGLGWALGGRLGGWEQMWVKIALVQLLGGFAYGQTSGPWEIRFAILRNYSDIQLYIIAFSFQGRLCSDF